MSVKTLVPSLLVVIAGCGAVMTDSQARVRVVHASPDAPAVDICANGDVLFSDAPFFAATDYVNVPAGTYTIKVVVAGSDCAAPGVIEADLTFESDSETTIAAINELSVIQPLVLADQNMVDEGMATVRFIHASPDAPTVDITLDDGTTLFDDIPFGQSGGYITVPPGMYDLDVRDMTGESVVLDVNGVQLDANTTYTVWATGFFSGQPVLTPEITVDNHN